MQLNIFRSLWGLEHRKESTISRQVYYEQLFSELRALGYHGIEASIGDVWALVKGDSPLSDDTVEIHNVATFFCALLNKNNLQYICGVYTSWVSFFPLRAIVSTFL